MLLSGSNFSEVVAQCFVCLLLKFGDDRTQTGSLRARPVRHRANRGRLGVSRQAGVRLVKFRRYGGLLRSSRILNFEMVCIEKYGT